MNTFSLSMQNELIWLVAQRHGWTVERVNSIVELLCSDASVFSASSEERFRRMMAALDDAGCPKIAGA